MNKYVKSFLHRGLIFGGFGPIVAGIVYLILSYTIKDFSLSGAETFLAILSTYILAFAQAGASVFNQIEHWPIGKSLLWHFATLYLAYTLTYLINAWIPFLWEVVLIFSVIFVAVYLIIWGLVYAAIKATSKRFNEHLR